MDSMAVQFVEEELALNCQLGNRHVAIVHEEVGAGVDLQIAARNDATSAEIEDISHVIVVVVAVAGNLQSFS